MTNDSTAQAKPRRRSHPGEFLRVIVLPEIGRTNSEIADLVQIPRKTFQSIVDCASPVTAAIAVKLAAAFGPNPEFWLRLQAVYDLDQVKGKVDVSRIERLTPVGQD